MQGEASLLLLLVWESGTTTNLERGLAALGVTVTASASAFFSALGVFCSSLSGNRHQGSASRR